MTHKELIVWKKSIELVVQIYKFTNELPSNEKYGLVSQMQRAAVSISSNIAEGAGRNSVKDYLRFLQISKASLCELDTQYHICIKLEFCAPNPIMLDKLDHVGKLLTNHIKSLRKSLTT